MAKRKQEVPAGNRFGDGLVARNKRASFDYELEQRFEAGLVLMGSEVKMLRNGHADLSDAWCAIENGEIFVKGLNIPELFNAAFGHVAKRPRKLLLHAHRDCPATAGHRAAGHDRGRYVALLPRRSSEAGDRACQGKKKADKRRVLKERGGGSRDPGSARQVPSKVSSHGLRPDDVRSWLPMRLLAIDGDRVELRTFQAAAPGSRLTARLAGGHPVRVKVFRCVRDGDQFEVTGRLIDATRELRGRLHAELDVL